MTNTQPFETTSGFSPLDNRTLVGLTGKDRHRFLHSFCTANIKDLTPGTVTEAFVLDGKGKTLWFGSVLTLEDRLLLAGHGQFGPQLITHLDRYIIRDDVQLHDLSDSTKQIFVFGISTESELSQVFRDLLAEEGASDNQDTNAASATPAVRLPDANTVIDLCDGRLTIANADVAGLGYLIIISADLAETLLSNLSSTIESLQTSQLERRRIEHLTPWYGVDLNETNLPQELNRDDKAISFTKGCYLGQETVARIDALGHVNQMLVKIKISNPAFAEVGKEIHHQGKPIGRITSVAPIDSQWIALGLLRRQYAIPGTELADGELSVL